MREDACVRPAILVRHLWLPFLVQLRSNLSAMPATHFDDAAVARATASAERKMTLVADLERPIAPDSPLAAASW